MNATAVLGQINNMVRSGKDASDHQGQADVDFKLLHILLSVIFDHTSVFLTSCKIKVCLVF